MRDKEGNEIIVKLDEFEGKPIVMMPDGDFFYQAGELASFLMHLSILIPDFPDRFKVVPIWDGAK